MHPVLNSLYCTGPLVNRINSLANQRFSPKLLCVCALQAEAQPLIAHYRLKAIGAGAGAGAGAGVGVKSDGISAGAVSVTGEYRDGGLRLYANDRMVLVVSGIGKINAAVATAHALAQMPANCIALNIGIAGSDNQLGDIFIAQCIRADERSVYPPITFNSELPGITVHSVDQPCMQYQQNVAFDMEASAFVTIARRYVVAELVQSLKIISDNADHPLINASGEPTNRLDKSTIAALVESRIPEIAEFIDEMFSVASELPVTAVSATMASTESAYQDSNFYDLIETIHFTSSQSQQLQELLNRFRVLGVALPQTLSSMDTRKNKASALLTYLDQMLDNVYPTYVSPKNDLSNSAENNIKSISELSRD